MLFRSGISTGNIGNVENDGDGQAVTAVTLPSASRVLADKLLQMAEKGTFRAASLASDSLESAPAPEIRSVSDVLTALKVLRTAAGLDKADQGAQINVSLAMFQPFQGSEKETQGQAWSVHEGD